MLQILCNLLIKMINLSYWEEWSDNYLWLFTLHWRLNESNYFNFLITQQLIFWATMLKSLYNLLIKSEA